jgi:transposase-like protein
MANQYKCEDCGATFSSEAALEEHNRSMHSRFKCETCGEMFNSENELQTHNRMAHPEEERTPKR